MLLCVIQCLFLLYMSYVHVAVGEDFGLQNSTIVLYSGGHDLSFRRYVDIVQDDVYEGDENFFLELTSNDSAVVFNRSLIEGIIDDENPGERSTFELLFKSQYASL